MAHILIADTPEGAITLQRILQGHECTVLNTMSAAQATLDAEEFDLIIACLHFDESRMFEFMREVKKGQGNAATPIICFCSNDTPMSRLMHESLECSTKVLGAWMYLEEHSYNVYQDPDAELRRIMERCLTDGSRKDIQQQRLDIQRQRADLQQLRVLLQTKQWSTEMKEYLDGLKKDLEVLVQEVARLHLAADVQRASIATSRDLKDRVAQHVRTNENSMTSNEDIQSTAESGLSTEEDQVTAKEESREEEGQRQQTKKLGKK